jgi:N-acetylglutamate synthase-like GNAT family acetyltransferase
MIRQANKHDKTEIKKMMQLFRQESKIEQYKNLNNEAYWDELLNNLLAGLGIIYIEEGKGLIMGVIVPTIWCNKTFALQELAWYVMPEFRGTSVGYRLFKQFVEHGKQLKESGRINFVVLSKLTNSPDLKYGKHGFVKMDENWIQ